MKRFRLEIQTRSSRRVWGCWEEEPFSPRWSSAWPSPPLAPGSFASGFSSTSPFPFADCGALSPLWAHQPGPAEGWPGSAAGSCGTSDRRCPGWRSSAARHHVSGGNKRTNEKGENLPDMSTAKVEFLRAPSWFPQRWTDSQSFLTWQELLMLLMTELKRGSAMTSTCASFCATHTPHLLNPFIISANIIRTFAVLHISSMLNKKDRTSSLRDATHQLNCNDAMVLLQRVSDELWGSPRSHHSSQ